MADIRRTIKFWVRSLAYRQVIAAGGQRVDLQGQPVEEVSEAHRAHAAAELKNIQAKVAARQAASEAPKAGKGKAKSKPAEGKQPPAAQPPAQPAPPAPPKPASPLPAPAPVRLSSGTQATVTVARRPTLKLKKRPSS